MNKKIVYILLMLVALTSCKQDDYLDWKALNSRWLEQNKTQPGVVTTESGLQYKNLNGTTINPTQARPNYNSQVMVDYKLYLITSYGGYNTGNLLEEATGAVFNLQSVVKGFSEGVQKMHVNDDYMLFIPYDLGYGTEGVGTEGYYGFIPPYSTLIYQVHLSGMQ